MQAKNFWITAMVVFLLNVSAFAIPKLPKEVRGFCIAAPSYNDLDNFIQFIDQELASRKVNLLIMRIDYNYQYTSHPELVTSEKRSNDPSSIAALSIGTSGEFVWTSIMVQHFGSTAQKIPSVR
jgi:hypothetical protein